MVEGDFKPWVNVKQGAEQPAYWEVMWSVSTRMVSYG